MTDLGDLLDLPPQALGVGRQQLPCRYPGCGRLVYVDRAVYGYGEDCAEKLGLVVHRGRCNNPGQTGPDLLDELDAMARTVPGVCRAPALPGLAELPPATRCEKCDCCAVDLCAAALAEGAACLLLAPPGPAQTTIAALLGCPCAPVACGCTPPTHVRGITRCRHSRSAAGPSPVDASTGRAAS